MINVEDLKENYNNIVAEINRVINVIHYSKCTWGNYFRDDDGWRPYMDSPNSSDWSHTIDYDDKLFSLSIDTDVEKCCPFSEMLHVKTQSFDYECGESVTFPAAFLEMSDENIVKELQRVQAEYNKRKKEKDIRDNALTEQQEKNLLRNLYNKYGDPYADPTVIKFEKNCSNCNWNGNCPQPQNIVPCPHWSGWIPFSEPIMRDIRNNGIAQDSCIIKKINGTVCIESNCLKGTK